MSKFDESTTLKVEWIKKEKALVIQFPTPQGQLLGYEIIKLVRKAVKNYASDFDITTLNFTIKLKKEIEDE